MRSFPFQLTMFFITIVMFTGCAAVTSLPRPENPDDFAIRVKMFRPGNAIALYILEPDGTLRFGGGMDALNNQTTWTGRMNEDEIQRLRTLLKARNWFRTPPASTNGADSHRTIIALRRVDAQRRFTVYGENEVIQPILDALIEAASRRHEPYLRQLPEPGPQPDFQ